MNVCGKKRPRVHGAVEQVLQPDAGPSGSNLHAPGPESLDLVLAVRRASGVSRCGRKARSWEKSLREKCQISYKREVKVLNVEVLTRCRLRARALIIRQRNLKV